MAGSFTAFKRSAFATGRERVSSFLVLEDVAGVRARGVLKVNVSRETITSYHQYLSCVLCAGRRADFEVTPINSTIAVQGHFSKMLRRSIGSKQLNTWRGLQPEERGVKVRDAAPFGTSFGLGPR
jgi:hypothetical protein